MAQVATPSPAEGNTNTDPTQRRFRGAAKLAEYEVMDEKLGEGTFGVVTKARSRRTGAVVALKKIIMHNEKDGFPITALREVKLLKLLSHPNVLRLEEMAVDRPHSDEKGKSGKRRAILYMVMPYMDHDLSGMLNNPAIRFDEGQIKCYMQQLLEGVRYLHDSHILHRDMKAANILISNRGVLQIADFGLARHYDGVPPQPGGGNGDAVKDYTSLVVTRWYRPPELLLTLKRYTPAIDMWGVGCIFAEMFEKKPILEGKTDVDQCVRIFHLIGSPTDQTMPGWSELPGCEGRNQWERAQGDIDKRFALMGPQGLALLKKLLRLDWRRRVNAIDALQHEYFTTRPLPARPEDLPRYEDSHELDNRKRGQDKPRELPPAPKGGTVGMGPDDYPGSGAMNGYGYNDRPPRGYGRDGRDRGPPPGNHPPRGYDDRRGPPPADGRGPIYRPDRERARENRGPVPMNGNLPPRPADLPPRPNGPDRRPPPPATRGPPDDTDTYIPNYDSRPPPREQYNRGRGGDSREPDDRPPYRDADRPPRDRDRDTYRDRDRHPDRRTRSRSPDRGRGQREERERRERPPDRERELYRR